MFYVILCNKFPYYIVRFKPIIAGGGLTVYYQFPYYIVRFKLRALNFVRCGIGRFHTTQYDLNSNILPYLVVFLIGFHTTQYDLNQPNLSSSFHQIGVEFPYYIVRFKPFSDIIYDDLKVQFPYYIVRFKQYEREYMTTSFLGFHTTQYDLNCYVLPR